MNLLYLEHKSRILRYTMTVCLENFNALAAVAEFPL